MSRIIMAAPSEYAGPLGDLYRNSAQHVLLEPSIVEEFHRQFCDYVQSADPVFLLRMVSGQVRGETLRTDCGAQVRPTDNSPAWWIHQQLFSGQFQEYASFATFVEAIPCHMFRMGTSRNISTAGWHVAHIFDVKDGDVSFEDWDRDELIRRTARNIHPCNYFYIPKTDWQRHGGDPTVRAFFCEKFDSIYGSVWADFLRLIEAAPPLRPADAEKYIYSFSRREGSSSSFRSASVANKTPNTFAAQYSFSRLCFKADTIEPLRMDDKFCIDTKNDGSFAMTKREFYEVFPNVVKSKSYQLKRIYHFPTPPRRALQFRLEDS